MDAVLTAPNREYLELTFVKNTAVPRGKNEKVIMEADQNGEYFVVTKGRIGVPYGAHKPTKTTYLMNEWDKEYTFYVNRGWGLVSQKKLEKKSVTTENLNVDGQNYKPIRNYVIRTIVEKLLAFANKAISDNFTVKVEDISDEMLTLGQNTLNELSLNYKTMSVSEFNDKLTKLYQAIPRRMDKVAKYYAKWASEFPDIIAREQDIYDMIYSQVRGSQKTINNQQTILEGYDLEWREVTDNERGIVKNMLRSSNNNLSNVWRVKNLQTEKRFDEFCKKENLTEENGGISHLFHGSRNEYYWSIITTGLKINPQGVITNGKMFGNGTYFAPLAAKSMGYTSCRGSKWAHGDSSVAYLLIYKVATGKQYHPSSADSSLNWKNLQSKCHGAHCTWAKGGMTGLRFDEVIVYQDCQSTLEYVVEVKA